MLEIDCTSKEKENKGLVGELVVARTKIVAICRTRVTLILVPSLSGVQTSDSTASRLP
jgi:hypothetical protein